MGACCLHLTRALASLRWHGCCAGLSLYNVDAAVQGPKTGKKGKRSSSHAQRGGMLFTHRGFSGPAVLDLSHHHVMAMLRGTARPGVLKLFWR